MLLLISYQQKTSHRKPTLSIGTETFPGIALRRCRIVVGFRSQLLLVWYLFFISLKQERHLYRLVTHRHALQK